MIKEAAELPDIVLSTPKYHGAMMCITVRDDENSTNDLFIGGDVLLYKDGEITFSPDNEPSKAFFDKHKDEILRQVVYRILFDEFVTTATLTYVIKNWHTLVLSIIGKKYLFMPVLLKAFKNNHERNKGLLELIIKFARSEGYDYPEFRAIEKSLGTLKESKLLEALVPLENDDVKYLKSVLTKVLKKSKPDMYDFVAACDYCRQRIKRDVGYRSARFVRLDLSNIDQELHALIMRFTLAWYKLIVTEYERLTKKAEHETTWDLRNWIQNLRYSKFPASELDVIGKKIFKPKKVKESAIAKDAVVQHEDGFFYFTTKGHEFVRFKDKQAYLKVVLNKLRDHDYFGVRMMIQDAQENGYNYPEFKTIEKSLGKLNEEKGYHGIYSVAWGDIPGGEKFSDFPGGEKFIAFKDKKKFIHFCLHELKSNGPSAADSIRTLISMARRDGYDYPEFKIIEKSLGKLNEENEHWLQSQAYVTFFIEHLPRKIRFSDKDKFLKAILYQIKHGTSTSNIQVKDFIRLSRKSGYDYPEFKAIEKSLNLKEARYEDDVPFEDSDIAVNGGLFIHVGDAKLDFVKFSNKEQFIKQLLKIIKRGDDYQLPYYYGGNIGNHEWLNSYKLVRKQIADSRHAGYDYPEFKIIEKSIGTLKESTEDTAVTLKQFASLASLKKNKIRYRGILFSLENTGKSHPYGYDMDVTVESWDADTGSACWILYTPGSHDPFEIIFFDSDEAFDQDVVLNTNEYLKTYLGGNLTDKNAVVKKLLQLYKYVIEQDDKTGGPETANCFELLIKTMLEHGLDWPEVKATKKSLNSRKKCMEFL